MNKYFCQYKKEQTAHWSRFPVFVQQLFFSRFLANFDAQYGKIRVFWGRGIHFWQKYRAALGNGT